MKKIIFSLFFLTAFVSIFPSLSLAEEETTPSEEAIEAAEEEADVDPKKAGSIDKVVTKVNQGTETILDKTIKGAYKVATLGMSDLESYEVQEPEKGSGEPTKFKISIPGT